MQEYSVYKAKCKQIKNLERDSLMTNNKTLPFDTSKYDDLPINTVIYEPISDEHGNSSEENVNLEVLSSDEYMKRAGNDDEVAFVESNVNDYDGTYSPDG